MSPDGASCSAWEGRASPDDAEQKGKPELEHIICLVAEKMSGLGWMWVNGAGLCFVE